MTDFTDDDKILLETLADVLQRAAIMEDESKEITDRARASLFEFADEWVDKNQLRESKHVVITALNESEARTLAKAKNPTFEIDSVETLDTEAEGTTDYRVYMTEAASLMKFSYTTEDGRKIGRTLSAGSATYDCEGLVRDYPGLAEKLVTITETTQVVTAPGEEPVTTTSLHLSIDTKRLEKFVAKNPAKAALLGKYVTPAKPSARMLPRPKAKKVSA